MTPFAEKPFRLQEDTPQSDPLGSLPPALVTGHAAVDFEHAQLLSSMQLLHAICTAPNLGHCQGCSTARQQACDGQLVGLLGDLLAFILEHFQTEESIMRDSLLLMLDRDVCEAHMEDHARISGEIERIVVGLDQRDTLASIRALDILLRDWVGNHIGLHDLIVARWIERRD